MTAQISDSVRFRAKMYDIAGKNGTGLFEPTEHGIEPLGACTACWHGYVCTYAVENNRFILDNLAVFLEKPAPMLFGAKKADEGELFDAIYKDLNYPISYTGGLLLGDDFIEELYIHMGFHPAWKYREVHELIFREGQLEQATDRSDQIAEFRDETANRRLHPDSSANQDDIARWIEQCFSQDYKW